MAVKEREPTLTTGNLEIGVDGKTHRGQRVVLTVSETEIRQEHHRRSTFLDTGHEGGPGGSGRKEGPIWPPARWGASSAGAVLHVCRLGRT